MYVDAADERLTRKESARFDSMVEAVRIGYLTARDHKNYTRWKSRRPAVPGRKRGASGADLERQIFALAYSHPDIVAVRT